MRAIAVSSLRADPALVVVPKPDPGPGEVRVRIEYASLNPCDWQLADGTLDGLAPQVFPLVVGVDYAGHVDMIGSGDNRFRVGDHVFGRAGGPAAGAGTYGDYVCVPQDSAIALVPRGLDARIAAALPSAGMAAAQILEAVSLRGHESLLVVGAAGGVGSCLTQLAKARDVRVIAAVRGDERSRMGSLGAAVTIDVAQGPVADAIRASCPDGVDALADLASATPEAFAAHAATPGRAPSRCPPAASRPGRRSPRRCGASTSGSIRARSCWTCWPPAPRTVSCASPSTSNCPWRSPRRPWTATGPAGHAARPSSC